MPSIARCFLFDRSWPIPWYTSGQHEHVPQPLWSWPHHRGVRKMCPLAGPFTGARRHVRVLRHSGGGLVYVTTITTLVIYS